jgi:DNA-binding transcriptional MerR regulator
VSVAIQVELPDKLYFKIGEVAKIADVKQHVLRYWESEFGSIRPQKSKSNQRLYRRSDVEAVLAVKHLLYDQKFTIEGARKHLKSAGVEATLPPPDPEIVAARARADMAGEMEDSIQRLRAELRAGFEKDLLALRQQLVDFASSLEEGDETIARPSKI